MESASMQRHEAPARNFDFRFFDETVEVVPYCQTWPLVFEKEAQAITKVFTTDRLVAGIEHYGSTAVQNLCAKPIIDILIGLDTCSLSEQEVCGLEALGYEYIGRARSYERFFLRKRLDGCVNLAVVRYAGEVWVDSLAVRDYLRAHERVAQAYERIKFQALKLGCSTILSYADYKREFVQQLVEDAHVWSLGR